MIQKHTDQRKTYLDFLRIIAAFFVILHHTPALKLYQQLDGAKTWLYASVSSFTMLNTPIFFMISGALLLRREESINSILKHRVTKYIAIIFLINYAMYWVYGYPSLDLGTFDFIPRAIKGNIDGVYWFLYAYLAFLLLLPFLQKAIKGMTWGHFWLLLSLRFLICTLLPVLNFFLRDIKAISIHASFDISFAFDRWIFFPVIGYFIDQSVNIEQMKPKHIILILAACLFGILCTDLIMIYEGITTGFSVQFVQIFDYITAICVFLIVKYLFIRCQLLRFSGICKAISLIGSLTLGIYLLDPIGRHLFFDKFSGLLPAQTPMIIVCALWCICSMGVCGAITYLLKRVPIIRKLL